MIFLVAFVGKGLLKLAGGALIKGAKGIGRGLLGGLRGGPKGRLTLDIEVKPHDYFRKFERRLTGSYTRITFEGGIERVARVVHREIERAVPTRTGRLRASMRLQRINALEYHSIETKEYGEYVKSGVPAAKINPIVPVRKKALYWPGAAHPVRLVNNHPGIRPNPYHIVAVKRARPGIESAVKDMGGEIIDNLKV